MPAISHLVCSLHFTLRSTPCYTWEQHFRILQHWPSDSSDNDRFSCLVKTLTTIRSSGNSAAGTGAPVIKPVIAQAAASLLAAIFRSAPSAAECKFSPPVPSASVGENSPLSPSAATGDTSPLPPFAVVGAASTPTHSASDAATVSSLTPVAFLSTVAAAAAAATAAETAEAKPNCP
ncbi:unnamed protein product [Closterium sp. NIES-54]